MSAEAGNAVAAQGGKVVATRRRGKSEGEAKGADESKKPKTAAQAAAASSQQRRTEQHSLGGDSGDEDMDNHEDALAVGAGFSGQAAGSAVGGGSVPGPCAGGCGGGGGGATAIVPAGAAEDPLAAIQRQLAALAPIMPTLSGMAQQLATITPQIQELHAGYQQLAETVQDHAARLDHQARQLQAHSDRITELEVRVGALSVGGGGPAQSGGGVPSPARAASPVGPGEPAAPPPFEPSYVEARGWCSFEDRTTQGLSKAQCAAVADALKGHLDPQIAARMGEAQVRGLKNFTFRVPVRGGLATCLEITGIANDLVKSGRLSLPEAYTDRSALRWAAERSPEAQAKLAALLRILRAAEHAVKAKAGAGEAAWAAATAAPNWRDNAVEVTGGPGGAFTVCEIGPGGTHKWNPEGLTALGFAHPGPFLAAAPSGRR